MKAGTTLAAAQSAIQEKLQPHTETPAQDARVLLAHICQRDKSWLLAHLETPLSDEQVDELNRSLNQLLDGTPLPYVLGEWEFFGRRFKVTPDVLIPRPETELLVETALEWLGSHPEKRNAAEVGTGSGCIAVSLAAAVHDLKITATDISPQALTVAGENIAKHGLEDQIAFSEDDLLTHQPGPFDLISANLPYIPTGTLQHLPIYQREPTLALDGGKDGLALVERLLAQSIERLSAGGLILLEIEAGQGQSALTRAGRFFHYADIHVLPDLVGHPRLLMVQT
jgi:release factor glutamine methyltransferase